MTCVVLNILLLILPTMPSETPIVRLSTKEIRNFSTFLSLGTFMQDISLSFLVDNLTIANWYQRNKVTMDTLDSVFLSVYTIEMYLKIFACRKEVSL